MKPSPAPTLGTLAALFAASFVLEAYAPVKAPRASTASGGKREPPDGGRPANMGQANVGEMKTRPPTAAEKRSFALIVKNILIRIGNDNLTLVAAGVAFYAMTAIFPAIAAFVSIYGLFADPKAVDRQIEGFGGLLPPDSLKILTDALASYSGQNHSTLNFALVVSLVLAVWSAKAGVGALMTGLNIANEQTEKRSFVVQQIVALVLTFGGILFAMTALTAVAILPAIIGFLPIGDTAKAVVSLARWPLLALVVGFAFAVIYRFGPYKEKPKWRWITGGAFVATLLWIAGSAGFSIYVSRFGSYNATYGSLAAAVVLLLWFWLSALVILVGAEVDAELERVDP